MAGETFVWGGGGQKLTPAQAKARREAADRIMSQTDAATTFGGGLAKIGQALQGVALDRQATEAEQAHAGERKAIMDGLMGLSDPSMKDIYSALGNDVVSSDPTSMAILNALMGDERQQADWARQDSQISQQRDWQLADQQAAWAREDEMFDRKASLPTAINDQLVDPVSGKVLGDYRTPVKGPTPTALMQNLEAAGLKPGTPEYQRAVIDGTKTGVTVNTGDNSGAFSKKADELAAVRLGDVVLSGQGASQFMGDMQALAALSAQLDTGKGAEIINTLGPYAQALGVDIGGLGEGQAYQAIIDRLAPQMRPVGSGATSDFDARQFLSSLPGLGKTPEGNTIIMQTLSAMQQHKMAAAEIASQAFGDPENGGITWQEAEKRIRELPNPYEGFNEYRKKGDAALAAAGARNDETQSTVDWSAQTAPSGWSGKPELWQYMNEDARKLFEVTR